ncbi:MAG: site-2 protease family protein [Candidatus Nanosalina sp.]
MSVMQFLQTVNPRLVFLVFFTALISFLMYRDRENVQRHSILFYRRTKKGINFIDRVAKATPRFWNVYAWTGVLLGFLTIPFILWNVLLSFQQVIQSGGSSGGPSLIAPGLSGQTTLQSGISFIPVEYWLIGIGVLMFVHEMSHGVIARLEGMEINSVGWIVMGIIPGAFVEPKGENMLPGEESGDESVDEEEGDSEVDVSGSPWDQGSWTSQLKVLAAGSFANYVTALIFTAAALLMFVNVAQPVGVSYWAQQNYSADMAGMDNGTIYELQGERIRYTGQLEQISEDFEPNQTVTVNTTEGVFNVTLGERNGSAYMGILMRDNDGLVPAFFDMVRNNREIKPAYSGFEGLISWTLSMLQTVALLNFLIGMFNLLPVKPLDGGQMVSVLVERFYPDGDSAVNAFSLLIWLALVTSLVYGFVAPVL